MITDLARSTESDSPDARSKGEIPTVAPAVLRKPLLFIVLMEKSAAKA
jgi:hypothetical protein